MAAFAQGAVLVGVAQLAQEPANLVRQSPGLFDDWQRGRKRDPAGLCVLQEPALERAALPGAIRVQPATAIRAQRRTRLGKASYGRLGAGKGHRQPERLQFCGIIAPLEFDDIEERAVAAHSAGEAELFA